MVLRGHPVKCEDVRDVLADIDPRLIVFIVPPSLEASSRLWNSSN